MLLVTSLWAIATATGACVTRGKDTIAPDFQHRLQDGYAARL
jgi:hypothetical protein